ncbi:TetR/AcrR family transcriptional regulator [Streptomyces kaniharaensis]|uniref:TetR/AcrR family transcriptional regulator n=1 Tax=Streptomyces kaniharaensis TaxID=212423 RepID=A0A6N7KZ61_9ACTN|nr:TetR/AcrR family transcriptional regulator [Streptomyces kaniharaensis]MQS15839.1 TetR/AcrR family transcriptional regulator [Streptomyces kaniharaensis]
MTDKPKQLRGVAVRDHLVDTAARLFYENGTHAVGVDEVVRRSGMAKASLYRWFPSKDDLILAVLQRRDDDFWQRWDAQAAAHPGDPRAELEAQLAWIEELATRDGYRGCAFVNTAAEFDAGKVDIRRRCLQHERELGRRLHELTQRLDVADSALLADQLHVAIVGAFAVGGIYPSGGPAARLRQLAHRLMAVYPESAARG